MSRLPWIAALQGGVGVAPTPRAVCPLCGVTRILYRYRTRVSEGPMYCKDCRRLRAKREWEFNAGLDSRRWDEYPAPTPQ